MEIFHKDKTVNLKIVYYGPALSGKTTNLTETFKLLKPEQRLSEKVTEITTESDGILKYECMPLTIGRIAGYAAKFAVYTVPGQIHYEVSRKLILKGADGVVFVADSQKGKGDDNLLSLMELQRIVTEQGKKLYEDVPVVLQFNKQDMENAMPPSLMAQQLGRQDSPHFAACAANGEGVIETFQTIVRMTVANVNNRHRQPATV